MPPLLGMPAPPLVPFDAAGLSPMARSFYDDNKRVRNALIKSELGVALRYPDYRAGLAAILAGRRCPCLKSRHPASSGHCVANLRRARFGRNAMATYNVLIMGASYGSLLATKLLFGGHRITLVCLPAEVEAFNNDGARVRLPIRGRKEPIELNSRKLPGNLSAAGPGAVNPADYDLVVLAMQEPQYRSPGVRELLDAVAKARVPCMSIMNMPPLPYLKRIPGLATDALRACYTDADVWENFEPGAADPVQPGPAGDPPAGRKDQRAAGDAADQLQGGALRLRQAHRDPAADAGGDRGDPLRSRRRPDRPAGQAQGARLDLRAAGQMGDAGDRQLPLRDEGCGDRHQGSGAPRPRGVALGLRLGARAVREDGRVADDLVPFEKYAAAANDLVRPSSAARALFDGAPNIERTDRLVQTIGAQYGMRNRDRRPDRGDGRCAARGQSQSRRLNRRRPMPGAIRLK